MSKDEQQTRGGFVPVGGLAYRLTIDQREVDAIDRILAGCPSTEKASRGLD